jgi:phage baseplate assembly protein gpV
MANGFYIGGFLNQAPSTFVELKQSGEIVITAPGGLTVNGNITVNGSQTLTGDCVAAGISLDNHIHTGDSGGTTSPPIG